MRVPPTSAALAILLGCGAPSPTPASPTPVASVAAPAKSADATPPDAAPRDAKPPEVKSPDAKPPDAKPAEVETPPEVKPPEPDPAEPEAPALDIEYVPTPRNVVAKMLEVAAITKDDVVYDLGCGDGRLVIAAAKTYGARAVGFDLDPERVAEARANVEKAKVGHLVTILQKNIFDVDLTPATVVTLYLLPELNVRLVPQLEKLAPKARIISHDFDMTGYDPDDIWMIVAEHHRPPPKRRKHYVYLWTTPLVKLEP
ncbi:MAG: 50S ribosomal protein L11 methyltransferase [Myxococcales bacterium]|nr:50S ribosomal protein L11 methyltransferase [Myxococcales bacterium]